MDAFSYASDNTIRAVLSAVCGDDHVRSKALNYLEMLEPQAIKAATTAAQKPGLKRKAHVGLSVCVQCDKPFDEQDNRSRDCEYHSGELEVDDEGDFWADHDENCHGIIDTKDMPEHFPQGFVWDCCDRLGDEPGCQRGRHQSNPDLSKKGANASESEAADSESSEEGDEDDEDDEDEEE